MFDRNDVITTGIICSTMACFAIVAGCVLVFGPNNQKPSLSIRVSSKGCVDTASKTIHALINKGISDAPVDPDAVIKEVCK